jgi:hypothetical protein
MYGHPTQTSLSLLPLDFEARSQDSHDNGAIHVACLRKETSAQLVSEETILLMKPDSGIVQRVMLFTSFPVATVSNLLSGLHADLPSSPWTALAFRKSLLDVSHIANSIKGACACKTLSVLIRYRAMFEC